MQSDEGRLQQVLFNLIGNAIKFTSEHGRVTVEARPVDDRKSVLFAVSDTGPGISGQDLPQVFDRFWRAKDGQQKGVGLAIAKGIVEAHGERIWVESRFYFTLPRSD